MAMFCCVYAVHDGMFRVAAVSVLSHTPNRGLA